MINRRNFEIYVIDYFDGKLSSIEELALFDFLENNSELKNEFNSLKQTQKSIIDLPEHMPDFSYLKKPLYDDIKIKYETLLIDRIEGNISSGGEQELNKALNVYQQLEKDEKLFLLTKLSPDKKIIFKGKNSLKKPLPVYFFRLGTAWVYAGGIAAALILTAFLFLGNVFKDSSNERQIVFSKIENRSTKSEKIISQKESINAKVVSEKTKASSSNTTLQNHNFIAEKNSIQFIRIESKKVERLQLDKTKTFEFASISMPEIHFFESNKIQKTQNHDEYLGPKNLLLKEYNKLAISKNLPVVDSSGTFNLRQLAQKANVKTGFFSYTSKVDESGNNVGFAFASKYFSIERTYRK